jgi:hypothetical protein
MRLTRRISSAAESPADTSAFCNTTGIRFATGIMNIPMRILVS